MDGIAKNVAAALNLLYTDKMDVYHGTSVTDDLTGISNTVYPDAPTGKSIPCRLSLKALDEPSDSPSGGEDIVVRGKVFCARAVEISAGDKVLINHNGAIFQYIAGEPIPRSSHIETQLLYKGRA